MAFSYAVLRFVRFCSSRAFNLRLGVVSSHIISRIIFILPLCLEFSCYFYALKLILLPIRGVDTGALDFVFIVDLVMASCNAWEMFEFDNPLLLPNVILMITFLTVSTLLVHSMSFLFSDLFSFVS